MGQEVSQKNAFPAAKNVGHDFAMVLSAWIPPPPPLVNVGKMPFLRLPLIIWCTVQDLSLMSCDDRVQEFITLSVVVLQEMIEQHPCFSASVYLWPFLEPICCKFFSVRVELSDSQWWQMGVQIMLHCAHPSFPIKQMTTCTPSPHTWHLFHTLRWVGDGFLQGECFCTQKLNDRTHFTIGGISVSQGSL
jgi:hypothetical protein